MQKVVIDTNVIISSFISSKGIPAKIVEFVISDNDFIICYNANILAEYKDVLTREKFDKYNFNPDEIVKFIKNVKKIGTLINPNTSDIPLPDESDRIFYDTAKAANAYLITGNLKYYPEEPHILTPTQFVEMFEK